LGIYGGGLGRCQCKSEFENLLYEQNTIIVIHYYLPDGFCFRC
jgi:hypothetical protein